MTLPMHKKEYSNFIFKKFTADDFLRTTVYQLLLILPNNQCESLGIRKKLKENNEEEEEEILISCYKKVSELVT